MLAAALAALACAAAPDGPAPLTRAYREAPSPARRAALERYAAAHPRDVQGALARLALGVAAFEQKDWERAVAELRAVKPRLPKLADYVAYYTAAARLEAKDATVEAKDLAPVRAAGASSPLAAQADVLEGRLLVAAGQGAEAVRVLRAKYAGLPQPEGDLALAAAYETAGNLAQAAARYQQVYYRYIAGDAGMRAAAALLALRDTMGAAYPQPSGALALGRADKMLAAREFSRARIEYGAMVAQVEGIEREQAGLRAAAADLLDGKTAACRSIEGLAFSQPEARAERLYYLVECARRQGDDDGMASALARLDRNHATSPWRFKALVSAANRYLVANRADRYVPLYQSAYEGFPDEPLAALCHWKVAWNAYISRQADAGERLRRHLERYPEHSTAAAALYFLGRLAERAGRFGEARADYALLARAYSGYYYGLLARDRLREPRLADAAPDQATAARLETVAFPAPPRRDGAAPAPATALRIERARLLRAAGLDDLAAAELRHGVRTGGQSTLLAVELARGGDSAFQSLRLIKSLRIDYFALPVAEAPAAFWNYLFPLPFRNDLVRNAQARKLDPFTVAALIRQESEFNPQAVSRANARGLTQVMPGTGRQLARKVGIRHFNSRMLFQPAVNLKLGTYYMRSLLDAWDGRWEETLAAYNAGPNRAREWVGWYRYEEPAEFVESIPFTETREYVQAVLRNAAMYRRIYGEKPVQVAEEEAPARRAPVKPAAARKRAKRG